MQELLRPFDAAGDDELVWWHPGGSFELPGEVVGAKAGHGGHLQGQASVEVLLDVIDDGAEPPTWQRAVSPARGLAGCQDVPDQVNGHEDGQ